MRTTILDSVTMVTRHCSRTLRIPTLLASETDVLLACETEADWPATLAATRPIPRAHVTSQHGPPITETIPPTIQTNDQ
jgi:hypothetical protein